MTLITILNKAKQIASDCLIYAFALSPLAGILISLCTFTLGHEIQDRNLIGSIESMPFLDILRNFLAFPVGAMGVCAFTVVVGTCISHGLSPIGFVRYTVTRIKSE